MFYARFFKRDRFLRNGMLLATNCLFGSRDLNASYFIVV